MATMTSSLGATLHGLSLGSVPRRGLFLLIASALVGICAVFVAVMVDARTDTRNAAECAEMNLATLLAQDIDRNIELLDLSVQAARDAWEDPRVRTLDPALRQLLLFDHSASARYIDAILVLDRDGAVVADSTSAVPRIRDLRAADFFTAQATRDAGLFIGRPMRMPGVSGWHIALSRRLSSADGGFAGVAVGFLNLGYLTETYKRLPLGADSTMTLVSTDGVMLVREPQDDASVGRSFRGRPVFESIKEGTSGTFEATATLDGRVRLFSYHRVGGLPLIQVVAATTESVYAAWRAKTTVLGAVLATLCAGTLALLSVLKRELVQRVAAESALEALASTDHLTGLLNRRKFFALADERRAGAAFGGLALTVVMIDVDHFKAYNDRYGHVAGDGVLKGIAGCISGELRGATDLAARFGGEEFIVLLPGLDRHGGLVVAEAIRAAVARLAVPHDRAAAGFITVSAGVASAEAGETPELRALVEAADAELYRSKREGRNRSNAAGERRLRPALPDALSA